MLTFLALPALIVLMLVLTGFVVVPIQRWAYKRSLRRENRP